MLIRYKKDLEKIAMGLLSFMPEEKKDVKKLQETIKSYETISNWHLFLWREEDILGAIGIRNEDDEHVVIQHITVNPSHRNMGIGQKMIQAVKSKYQNNYTVCADTLTEDFYHLCTTKMKNDGDTIS